ncbi:hypothetical protein CHUAL_011453 [Chamberlinius hualienensis]
MKFDDILDQIGECGTYQKVIVCLLYLPCMFCALQALSYVFISAVPRYRCFVNGCDDESTGYYEDFVNLTTPYEVLNEHQIYSRCQLYSSAGNGSLFNTAVSNISCPSYVVDRNHTSDCSQWKFDGSMYESTLVTEWSLVCNKSNLVALSQAMYMAGVMLGSISFGYIADRFGRKTALLLGLSLGTTLSTTLCWVPFYPLLLTFRFFIGACFQGIYQTAFVMTMELVGKSKRAVYGMLASVVYAFGEIALGFASYYVRDWKTLQLIISAPAFMFVIYYWLIPESPRWLLLKNRKSEALSVLENIAQSNDKDLPDALINSEDDETLQDELDLNISPVNNKEIKCYTWVDLFRTPYLRWISFNVLLNWFMNTLAYYGITMSTPLLGGSDWWNFIIVSAVEIPACLFGMLSINWFGRRRPLCGCMIIGGIAGTCTALIPLSPDLGYTWLAIILAMIGKFGAAAAFSIIYVFTVELYPTVIRNNAVGMSSMIGHSGGVVAPYIATLGYVNKALPLVIFGICSLVSGVLSLTLPETFGQHLPETIEDSENLGRRPFARLRGTEHDERVRLLTDDQPDHPNLSVNSDIE